MLRKTSYWLKSRRGGSDERFENVGELIAGEDGAWRAAGRLQDLGEDVAIVKSATTWFPRGGFEVVSRLHARLYAHVSLPVAQSFGPE